MPSGTCSPEAFLIVADARAVFRYACLPALHVSSRQNSLETLTTFSVHMMHGTSEGFSRKRAKPILARFGQLADYALDEVGPLLGRPVAAPLDDATFGAGSHSPDRG